MALLMGTHNICLRAKKRKKYPCIPEFYNIKVIRGLLYKSGSKVVKLHGRACM